MPLYRYTGRDSAGRGTAGKVEAADELDVAKVLEAAGYYVTSVEPAAAPSQKVVKREKLPFFRERIHRRDIIVLLRQFETLYRAGVPVATGIDILEAQSENRTLQFALRSIAIEIRDGLKLSEAFERHPQLFPPIVTANLLAGEETGALEEVLRRLADHLEHEDELERFVKGAIRYPQIVMIALGAVITMVLLFVFPKLTPLFRMFEGSPGGLPLPTKILKFVGDHAAAGLPTVLGVLGVGWVLFQGWKRSQSGRPVWESFVLRLPKVGPVLRKILVARFARSFAVVFRTGVPLLRALDIVALTLDHRVLAKEIGLAKLRMTSGMGIADAMKGIKVFPPLANHLLAVGEQTGQVDNICTFLAEHYESEARYELKNVLSLIEPVLTSVLAVFVGFTALAIFMPIWGLMDVIKK